MTVTELIEKHAALIDSEKEWSNERLKQFAIELMEMLLSEGQIEEGYPFIDVKLTMQAINKAMEELRK